MTTRSKYLFVTLQEFAEWLRESTNDLDAVVIAFRGARAPLQEWDGSEDRLLESAKVFVATNLPELSAIPTDTVPLGQFGWLQLDVPRTEETCLLATQIATKSDWFDPASGKVLENSRAIELYDRFWKQWRKRFRFPVFARNWSTGVEAPYASIGYSSGAAQWAKQHGCLRQRGVANIEFRIPTHGD
jgi:hypothetical protein